MVSKPSRQPLVRDTHIDRYFHRFVAVAQDLLVLGLMLILFALTSRTLLGLVNEVLAPVLDFRTVVAEVLFVLVMVEVVQLLFAYLREHRVAVDFMVEIAIVAALREAVLHGVVELPWTQLLALAVFLLVLTALLRYGGLRFPTSHRSAVRGSAIAGQPHVAQQTKRRRPPSSTVLGSVTGGSQDSYR